MKTRTVLACSASTLSAIAVAIACSSTPKGAVIVAMETDVSVPQDVNGLGIAISVGGEVKYSQLFAVDVTQHHVHLPATIAVVEPDSGTPGVTIRAVAFLDGKARVVRDAITTIPHERTVLLRMPLSFLALDDGVSGTISPDKFQTTDKAPSTFHLTTIHLDDAPTGTLDTDLFLNINAHCSLLNQQTNIDGECVDPHVDSGPLPDYVESDLFGEAGAAGAQKCFDMESCFGPSYASPVTLDKGNCRFPAPADTSHLNVAMLTDKVGFCVGGVGCLVPIDQDLVHGFSLAGDGFVHLPKGVCDSTSVKGIYTSRNPQWDSKAVTIPIDGAGALCLNDAASDGGNVAVEASAGNDSSVTDSGDSGTGLQPFVTQPGTIGITSFNGNIFYATTTEMYWADNTGFVKAKTALTNADAGTATVAMMSSDDTYATVAFAGTSSMFAVPYSSVATFQMGAPAVGMMFPMVLSGANVFNGDFYYSSNYMGAPYAPAPIQGLQDDISYAGAPGTGDTVAAYAVDVTNKQLYTVFNEFGGTQIYSYPMPPGGAFTTLGMSVPNVTATAAAIVINPTLSSDIKLVFLATNGNTVALKSMPTTGGTPVDLIANTGVSPTNLAPSLVTDGKGWVYYTDSSGTVQSFDVEAGKVPVPVVTGAGAKAVAVDGGFAYLAVANGVSRIKITHLPGN